MVERLPVLVFVALTSLGAYRVGVARLGLPSSGIVVAIGKTFESLGLTVVFLIANVAVGAGAILALRTLTPGFLSLYLAADQTLVVFSVVQAVAFQAWRDAARRSE